MARLLALLLLLVPVAALADPQAHDGTTATRSHPEYSDIALAAIAAGGVWFVRRALRKRFAPPPPPRPPLGDAPPADH